VRHQVRSVARPTPLSPLVVKAGDQRSLWRSGSAAVCLATPWLAFFERIVPHILASVRLSVVTCQIATLLRSAMLPVMTDFNYMAPAELFVGMGRGNARGNAMKYSRFPTSAEAIRHAVEKLNANALSGAALVVDEERYGAAQIRELYDDASYPLSRGPV
jgi:hypothetical protein